MSNPSVPKDCLYSFPRNFIKFFKLVCCTIYSLHLDQMLFRFFFSILLKNFITADTRGFLSPRPTIISFNYRYKFLIFFLFMVYYSHFIRSLSNKFIVCLPTFFRFFQILFNFKLKLFFFFK